MFTTLPQSYGSLYEDQIFTFESDSTEDQLFEIRESVTGDLIGVKKFYSIATANLNVAPIVRPYALPKMVVPTTQFVDSSSHGSIAIEVTKIGIDDTDSVVCEPVTLSLSHYDQNSVGLVTTLPVKRAISIGDGEQLLLRVDPQLSTVVTVEKYAYGLEEDDQSCEVDVVMVASQGYEIDPQSSGFALFSIAAEKLDGELEEYDLERVIVRVEQFDGDESVAEGEEFTKTLLGELTYYVIDPPLRPMRLAWISRRGSLEHYTMPYMISEVAGKSGDPVVTLRSALEDYGMRRSLAEIVESERLWVVDGDESMEVEFVGDGVELTPSQDLSTVEFKISYNG